MIELRDVRPSDREQLLAWRNMPEVAKWMYSDHVITKQEHDRWFEAITSDPASEHRVVTRDCKDVGLVNLSRIDSHHRRCELGIYIAERDLIGTGVGSAALCHLLDLAFAGRDLNRVMAGALSDNHDAIRTYERMGFRREAFLRQHIWKDETMRDVVQLAMLRDEWTVVRPALRDGLRERGLIS